MPRDLEKYRKFQRERVARIRREWFEANGPCRKCGSTENLELDHIDPATKDSRLKAGTGLWSWSEANRQIEIEKCQVLCHNCHWKKTLADLGWGGHGTILRYKKGCRCQLCRAIKAQAQKKYREHKKQRLAFHP